MTETNETNEIYGTLAKGVSLVHAAVTAEGSDLKNTKVVQRKIRVRVLDCRSGEPLQKWPVAEVSIDKVEAMRFTGDPNWDIVENYLIPVGGTGDPTDCTGFTSANRSKLQKLLNALGYNCGTPGKQFGEAGLKALKAFQVNWFFDHDGEKQPDMFEKQVTPEWQRRIIAEYNLRFYRTVQFYLSALNYPCSKDNGEWKEDSKNAFQRWQKVELGAKQPASAFTSKNSHLAPKLKEARKHFFSDDKGDIYIPVPVTKIRAGFKLKIGFKDFAIIAEQKGWRSWLDERPTGFSIEYVDSQDAKTESWGWRLRSRTNNALPAELPQFKTSLEFTVPAAAAPDYKWSKLKEAQLAAASFSPFYEGVPEFSSTILSNNLYRVSEAAPSDQFSFSPFLKNVPDDPPEIVVFALVWCQPVWDGIADPPSPATLGSNAYVQVADERNRNMHIVTKWQDGVGWDPYGGKGYGLFEYSENPRWRGKGTNKVKDGHPGLDLHALVADKAFAVHSGTVGRFNKEDPGNFIQLKWTGAGQTFVNYCHLSAFVAAANQWVRAGQIVGLTGRTGNLGAKTDNPSHVHLFIGGNLALRNTPDPANRVCIPYNDTPLLLPCRCEVTLSSADPSGCHFANATFTNKCWAVAELKCPDMGAAGQQNRRLQAQLRYVHESENGQYLDPGSLSGNLGAVPATPKSPAKPTATAAVSETRKAIRAFRLAQGLTESYEMDAAAWQRLNELAPVTAASD